jgi:hypothetical protein
MLYRRSPYSSWLLSGCGFCSLMPTGFLGANKLGPPAGFVLYLSEMMMIADGYEHIRNVESPRPEWARVWHLWTVIIPRRSITGRFIVGQVWRRHNGRHWIYRKFTEYAQDW